MTRKSTGLPSIFQKLLLHTCCADCAVKALAYLRVTNENANITLYFDNSNIHPRTEWLERLKAVQTLAKSELLELIVADWSPRGWFQSIQHNPENTHQRRCVACWGFRLKTTAEFALKNGFSFFSSTLLTSPYQDHGLLTKIGHDIAGSQLTFVENQAPDTSQTSSTTSAGFYKQNYCGCVYSLAERYEEKWNPSNNNG